MYSCFIFLLNTWDINNDSQSLKFTFDHFFILILKRLTYEVECTFRGLILNIYSYFSTDTTSVHTHTHTRTKFENAVCKNNCDCNINVFHVSATAIVVTATIINICLQYQGLQQKWNLDYNLKPIYIYIYIYIYKELKGLVSKTDYFTCNTDLQKFKNK